MIKRQIKTFEEAEGYINETPRFTTKNTIEDTKAFLHRLGNPDWKMKIIHVAGTNGKGSVCAYLRSILEEAGFSTALFTSPHLVDIRERFSIDGEMISRGDFLRAFLLIYDMLDWKALEAGRHAYHPTYFEYLFLIAMVLFAEKSPDYCILETGLGGRLDATNAVSKKELALITHISLEHVEYLGDTLAKIAGEKAGIMQRGAPVVYWDTCEETTAVFEAKAAELGIFADLVSKKDYRFLNFGKKSIDFSVHTGYYGDITCTLRTIAIYQMENAALAVRAIGLLNRDGKITGEQIKKGLEACFWAGRMEEVLPEVYVDGAHNDDGIRAFLETVRNDGHKGPRSLLFGVVQDKDYGHMVERLTASGLFDRIALARMRTKRAVPPKELEKILADVSSPACAAYSDVPSAFRGLLGSRRENERVYIAGSLYLAGEIKEFLQNDKF